MEKEDVEYDDLHEALGFWRHDIHIVVLYSVCYSLVFVGGLLGNTFVLLAVAFHLQVRSTTDLLIGSLAAADLLILLFCLPTTLFNNVLTEWQLGDVVCKASVWMNSTTSCASIYTLVAVTLDRYLAICHTLKYTLWESAYTVGIIAGIWIGSSVLAVPSAANYAAVHLEIELGGNVSMHYILCISQVDEKLQFVLVNLLVAFFIPFLLISISYALIFIRVSTHRSLAVDAAARDERVKLRVAQMMLTVIVVFALCWIPLYGIYCYFTFLADQESTFFEFASSILRPFFQWLSLLSSSINPLIYIAYSHKYRHAFHQLLVSPCRKRYAQFRGDSRMLAKMENEELRARSLHAPRSYQCTPSTSTLRENTT